MALAVRGDRVARLLHRPWRTDPYPVFAELRAAQVAGGPVRSSTGLTALATHASVEAVLRDRRFGVRLSGGGSRLGDGGDAASLIEPVDLSLLTLDPPDHTRLRRLAQPAFAPRRLEHYRAVAERVTGELLDAALARGGLRPGPRARLPAADHRDRRPAGRARRGRRPFARWGLALGSSLDGVRSPAHARELARATADLRALFADLLEQRRAHPGEDVVSTLAAAVDGGTATADEVLSMAQLLLVAGFETTTNLIGNAVQALHRTPGQWEALVADPAWPRQRSRRRCASTRRCS